MRTWKRLVTTTLCAGAASLLGACGDDGGGGDDDPNMPDANVDAPDAEDPPMATRAMTIAVTDVRLTSPNAVAAGIRGGAISIEFSDLTQGGGERIYGTNPIGGCVVTRYDATHPPNPTVDAGEVTIGAPEEGDSGLRKVVGPCTYAAGLGYTCSSHGGTDVTVTATPSINPQTVYTFAGQNFGGADLAGAWLAVNGFSNAANNGTFPIVGQAPVDPNLVVVNPGGTTETTQTGSFRVLNGLAPTPAGTAFLSDETTAVRIQKDAHGNWPEIDVTYFVRGQGFRLSEESTMPHNFPSAPQDVVFDCAGTGGICGLEPDQQGVVKALILSGRTTDVNVTGTPDFYMPPASAATAYTTFQCAFPLADTATIPEDAVEAILSTNPTRVETRVLRVIGGTPMDGLNSGRILVGYGIVGHATITN